MSWMSCRVATPRSLINLSILSSNWSGQSTTDIEDRERQIRELQQQKKELQQCFDDQICKLQKKIQRLQQKLQKMEPLTWGKWEGAPMIRGSATACGSMAYFRPGFSQCVQVYNSDTEEWFELPICPTEYFTLAVVNGLLTAVGGWESPWFGPNKSTNTLLSLITQKGGKKKWVEHFLRMPTKRDLTAVVCSEKALVVAGGVQEKGIQLTTVEVMDIKTYTWSTASSLPHSLYATLSMLLQVTNNIYSYNTENNSWEVIS